MSNSIVIALLSLLCASPLGASNRGSSIEVSTYRTKILITPIAITDSNYTIRYSNGQTFYGSTAFKEGIAADPQFYPVGTKICIPALKKYLVVDDVIPAVLGTDNIIVRLISSLHKPKFKTTEENTVVCLSQTLRSPRSRLSFP